MKTFRQLAVENLSAEEIADVEAWAMHEKLFGVTIPEPARFGRLSGVNCAGKKEKMTTVLVTGSSGFLAKHLILHLKLQNHKVFGITRKANTQDILEPHETIYADVSDSEAMRRIIQKCEPEIVYHVAAEAIVRIADKDPLTTYRSNVMGTVSVLEAVRHCPTVKKTLVASSDKAYGHAVPPYQESTAFVPKGTYETSKAAADWIARSYATQYGLDVCVVRSANIYGPWDPNQSRLVPRTIANLAAGKPAIVYAHAQNMLRQFIHVDDACRAYLFLAQAPTNAGEAYNIGGAEIVDPPALVDHVAAALHECFSDWACPNPVYEIRKLENPPTEIETQAVNTHKIELLGWSPRISLISGIIDTVARQLSQVTVR